jgi:hypothetical protein
MGDCGAFTYVREPAPPYSIEDVSAFYVDCGFDYGISVDHVILDYNQTWDESPNDLPDAVAERQSITIDLARRFFQFHRDEQLPFVLLGVAQGWSPKSYAQSVRALQKIGFRYIAVGGMVPLKTHEITASLRAIARVRRHDTRFHLLGITRTESLAEFASLGVASFDSTSPLRQAFKDATDNYYSMDSEFTAIRIPQVEGNATLQKLISSGQIEQDRARRLERAALLAMRRFDAGEIGPPAVLDALEEYEACYAPNSASHREHYATTLDVRPWKSCACDVCATLGHHVILFRGAERNRRRGLHNTWTFYRRVQRQTATASKPRGKSKSIRAAASGEN